MFEELNTKISELIDVLWCCKIKFDSKYYEIGIRELNVIVDNINRKHHSVPVSLDKLDGKRPILIGIADGFKRDGNKIIARLESFKKYNITKDSIKVLPSFSGDGKNLIINELFLQLRSNIL